ncbi:MAG: hypothetical protein HUJ68_01400 [Clostridia bacterium]|nr:hypothetical protein [Clostridia bacterium]
MNNFNFDESTLNKVKKMLDNGDLSDVMSKISPEMINNVSSMINNSDSPNPDNSSTSQTTSNLGNIDMNTILKMKSIIEKMNNKNDARSNLLCSLKPYLRDEKKNKIDQYTNLINMAKIAELMKQDNKENS